jgi:hypothetical protein
MWKQNFMFRASESMPLKESEQELFHETDPAVDSAGVQLEKFLSGWIQGRKRRQAVCLFKSLYSHRHVGFSETSWISPASPRPVSSDQTAPHSGAEAISPWLAQ